MTTPLQVKVYDYICNYIHKHNYSPTLVEIASGIGISPRSVSLVSRCLRELADRGLLRFYKKGARNIEIIAQSSLSLPLLGCIAAGSPIEAIPGTEIIDIGSLLQGTANFVLKVKGDSMIDEGILDGDFVICKSTQSAKEGEIVVALINQADATLKRISYKIADKVTLIPANPNLKPRSYSPERVQIQGVYVGLLRMSG